MPGSIWLYELPIPSNSVAFKMTNGARNPTRKQAMPMMQSVRGRDFRMARITSVTQNAIA